MGEVLGDLVEISPRTWVALEVFFCFVFAVSFAPIKIIVIIYWIFGYALLLEMGIIAAHLNKMKLQLIPRVDKHHVAINESAPLLTTKNMEPPAFLKLKLQRRTKLGRFLFGTPANKHQLLFFGNTKGPELLIFVIRLLIILSAIYLSGLLFICYVWIKVYEDTWWFIFIIIVVAVIPISILAFFYTPRVLRLQVLVCNIEMLKNQEVINKVLRTQKTAKSLKTLKVIQLLKFKTRKQPRKNDEEAAVLNVKVIRTIILSSL